MSKEIHLCLLGGPELSEVIEESQQLHPHHQTVGEAKIFSAYLG